MRVHSFVVTLASAGALLASGPAFAGEPVARVAYDDLQLTSPAGQAELEKRITKAAWRVCMFDANGDLRTSEQHAACYRTAQRSADVRVAQIVAEYRLAAEASNNAAGG